METHLSSVIKQMDPLEANRGILAKYVHTRDLESRNLNLGYWHSVSVEMYR